MIHTVDISDAFYRRQWIGGRSVQLQVNRAAVLGETMGRINKIDGAGERFRAQAKVVISGETAAEWSPVCASPIFQDCHICE
jgi:molybdopterin/thiamine biosynthesis adenylyltransferase